jgi:hypothetical protein
MVDGYSRSAWVYELAATMNRMNTEISTSKTMDVNINAHREMSKFEANVWFWSVAGFFAAVWVLLPSLLHTGYRNDVIEMQCIAPEWTLSTKKLPNMPAWILEIINIITSRAFAAPFIASQLCTLSALWSIWKLGRTVLNERLALIGAFSLLPYNFFTTESILYNHNNVLVAFWCLSIYLVWQAFQTNKKRYWFGAGIVLGLTFHTKYPVVFLVAAILTYMFMRKEGRKYRLTPGPYITTLTAFMVFLPNLIWLFSHDFAPLHYIDSRPALSLGHQMIEPFSFAVKQLRYCIPPLIITIPVIGFAWKWKTQHHKPSRVRECEKFLFYCMMVPLVGHMLYCGIKGADLRMAYGAPFWGFMGLWLILRFQTPQATLRCFRSATVLTVSMELTIITGFLITFCSGKQVPLVYYPMHRSGEICECFWQKHFSVQCPYIGGDAILPGYTAHTMSVRPSVIMPQGTWADDDDLNQKGGMIVWERKDETNDMPEYLRQRFPQAEVLPDTPEIPYKVGKTTHVLKIGIAIVPPPDQNPNGS